MNFFSDNKSIVKSTQTGFDIQYFTSERPENCYRSQNFYIFDLLYFIDDMTTLNPEMVLR